MTDEQRPSEARHTCTGAGSTTMCLACSENFAATGHRFVPKEWGKRVNEGTAGLRMGLLSDVCTWFAESGHKDAADLLHESRNRFICAPEEPLGEALPPEPFSLTDAVEKFCREHGDCHANSAKVKYDLTRLLSAIYNLGHEERREMLASRPNEAQAVTPTTSDHDRACLWIDEMADLGVIGHYREAKAKGRLADLLAEVRADERASRSDNPLPPISGAREAWWAAREKKLVDIAERNKAAADRLRTRARAVWTSALQVANDPSMHLVGTSLLRDLDSAIGDEPCSDSATSVHAKHGVSDGDVDPSKTSAIPENTPQNAVKRVERIRAYAVGLGYGQPDAKLHHVARTLVALIDDSEIPEYHPETATSEGWRAKYGRLEGDVRGIRSVLRARDDEGNLACAVRAACLAYPTAPTGSEGT